MMRQFKNGLRLLLLLGLLFALPVAAKTLSAHGALPAVATGLIVVLAILLGPVSFAFSRHIEGSVSIATSVATDAQVLLVLAMGAGLSMLWYRALRRRPDNSMPYVIVTAWALVGAHFCLLHTFAHIT